MEFTFQSIQDSLTGNHVPEIVLAIGGVIALLIVFTYIKDKDGLLYKFMVLVGLVVGAALIIISIGMYDSWALSTSIIVIVAGFTLIIRPFRELEFAIILALLAIALVYVLLGDLAGSDFEVLSEGWPRIAVAVLAGILVYTISHFVQALVQMFGKLLNWWPVLLIVGIICIVEAVAIYQGHASIYEYIDDMFNMIQVMS